LKHTRKHERRKERIEPRSKTAMLWRTVRPGGADCPQRLRGLSGRVSRTVRTLPRTVRPEPRTVRKGNRTSRDAPRITDHPRGPRGLSARHPWTVCPEHADCPKPCPTKTQSHDGSKTKPSKNTKNTRQTRTARTVCQVHADRPRSTDRAENCTTPIVNTPNPSPDLPNGRSC
jgi:hypothetical protein